MGLAYVDQMIETGKSHLEAAKQEGEHFGEAIFAFRGGECLLVVEPPREGLRRLMGTAAAIARAERVLYLTESTIAAEGAPPMDVLVALHLRPEVPDDDRLELHPFSAGLDGVTWADPLDMGNDRALFGEVITDLRLTFDLSSDVERLAALRKLHETGCFVQVAPRLDDEIVQILGPQERQ